MKNSYIGQAWLVILLSLCFGGVLAGVQLALQQRIEENKLAETRSQIPLLVPGAREEESKVDTVAGQRVYRALSGGRQIGWVIAGGGQGFADRIELLKSNILHYTSDNYIHAKSSIIQIKLFAYRIFIPKIFPRGIL